MKMKKLHLLALMALIMLGLSGCEKATVTNEAYPDVFVKAIKNTQGATVFTTIHSVFSYNTMSSVSVTSPGGTSQSLKNYENAGYSFYNEPAEADFSTTTPTAGTYAYTVKFNDGEEKPYTNSLTSSYLLPPNITSLTKSTNGDSIYFKWDAVANTNAYQLKVMKGTKIVYSPNAFADSSNPLKAKLNIVIPITTILLDGTGTYTFELSGLLLESTNDNLHLQAIGTSTKDITL